MRCRSCQSKTVVPFVDLATSPPSNAYVTRDQLNGPERWFPLRVFTCASCWLVQTEDFTDADALFDKDYAYFSSFSNSWLAHCERYVEKMTSRFGLDDTSMVVEVAANDGYMLDFVRQRGIPCYGVEPTASTAAVARSKGIEIVEEFFGEALGMRLAAEGRSADLTAAKNVLAHVPDIVDFVKGFTAILKPKGVATFEFPHLAELIRNRQFDTIYHEHFSYLSLLALQSVFELAGLEIFDVEQIPTHGGSLRLFAQRADTRFHAVTDSIARILGEERALRLDSVEGYADFQQQTEAVKNAFLAFLLKARAEGATVAGYGAAAKGNTLMNYAGARGDLVQMIADRNPAKQDQYTPGGRIPIVDEATFKAARPDYVIIFPWNLKTEITGQLAYIREWKGRFVTAIPSLEIW